MYNKSMKKFKTPKAIKTLFEKEPPFNGGNSFQTKMELEQQEIKALNNLPVFSSEFKSTVDDIFKPLRYEEFRLLLFQAKYFCNIFPLVSESVKLTNAISQCKYIAFFYGRAAIYRESGKFIPCYIKKSKKSLTGEITYLELALGDSVLSFSGATASPKPPTTFKLQNKEDIDNNVVFMNWDTLSIGAYYMFLPFIKLQLNLLDMLTTEGFTLIKKLNYHASGPDVIKDEMKNFFNPRSPFNIFTPIEDEMRSRFKVLDLNESDKNNFLQYFEFTMNTYYSLLGRRFNVDMKPERNVSGEVEASQSNFDILEAEHVVQMENFIKDFKNKFGITIKDFKEELENDIDKTDQL